MKKLVAGILAAAFVLSVSATSVFAMGGRGLGFVDEDGGGVCDYYGTGRGAGRGLGFVDEDGDGVCDYYGTGRCARYADTSNS